MKFFLLLIAFLFVLASLSMTLFLWKVRRRVHKLRDAMENSLNDEAFQRMADKDYYRKHRNEGPEFSDNYFSGDSRNAASFGGQQQNSQQNSQQQSTRRTTHTSNGVTIIDDREPNRKIFTHDEGDYVDFKEA